MKAGNIKVENNGAEVYAGSSLTQLRSQSSSAISDVTSAIKLVGKIRRGRYRTRFQASSGNSDSANWPGYEAVSDRAQSFDFRSKIVTE